MKTPFELNPGRFLSLPCNEFPDNRFPNLWVRVVLRGDHYGRSGNKIHSDDEPIVELLDGSYNNDPWRGIDAELVAYYHLTTLLKRDYPEGFTPYQDIQKWHIGFNRIKQMQEWLKQYEHEITNEETFCYS